MHADSMQAYIVVAVVLTLCCEEKAGRGKCNV
jgi:hypothetical protein